MRIEVLTSLYPSRERPVEGVFAERRWSLMRARGHEVRVTQPLPFASRWLPLERWRALARVPSRETRSGIDGPPRTLLWKSFQSALNARLP